MCCCSLFFVLFPWQQPQACLHPCMHACMHACIWYVKSAVLDQVWNDRDPIFHALRIFLLNIFFDTSPNLSLSFDRSIDFHFIIICTHGKFVQVTRSFTALHCTAMKREIKLKLGKWLCCWGGSGETRKMTATAIDNENLISSEKTNWVLHLFVNRSIHRFSCGKPRIPSKVKLEATKAKRWRNYFLPCVSVAQLFLSLSFFFSPKLDHTTSFTHAHTPHYNWPCCILFAAVAAVAAAATKNQKTKFFHWRKEFTSVFVVSFVS